MPTDLTTWVSTIISAIVAVISAIIAVRQKVKSIKWFTASKKGEHNTQLLTDSLNSVQEYFSIYQNELISYMTEAENMGMTGDAKKTYVKSKIVLLFQQKGLTYDDSLIDKLIEGLITFSKSVNVTKTVTSVVPPIINK